MTFKFLQKGRTFRYSEGSTQESQVRDGGR
jgi:hypothetical protein